MTTTVDDFFERIDTDDEFAQRLYAASADAAAVQAIIAEAGFDLEPSEVTHEFLERFGDQLTEEQLAAVAGGLSSGAAVGVALGVVGGTAIVGIAIGAAAAAI